MDEFWEKCSEAFAHIKFTYQSEEEVVGRWRKEYLEDIDWHGKTVIDYGCGGGLLGQVLAGLGIRKYIGLDIAERQVSAASDRVPDGDIRLLPVDLKEFNADILVCQAVMHHMNKATYEKFLADLNESGIPELVLQWRHGHSEWFDIDCVRLACFCNWRDIASRLTNYNIVSLGEIGVCDTRYGRFRKA